MTNKEKNAESTEQLKICFKDFLESSRQAAKEWQDKSQFVWDMIHGRVDWSHKSKTMAKIHLNKVGLAYERIKAQFKKSLMNFDEWLTVEETVGNDGKLLTAAEAKRLVDVFVEDSDLKSKISEVFGNGAAENVTACKFMPTVKKRGKSKQVCIDIIPLNIRNFYFDPFGSDLYKIHEVELDKFQLLKMAADKPSLSKPYYMDKVKGLMPYVARQHTEKEEDKGNDLPQHKSNRRCNIVLHEYYGTLLDEDGNVLEWVSPEGEVVKCEDVVFTMANELELISDVKPIARLNKHAPFVQTRMLHTGDSVYGKAPLFPGATTNLAQNEIASALTDGAMRSVFNLLAIKRSALEDPKQFDGGFNYAAPVFVTDSLDGQAAITPLPTGNLPPSAFQVQAFLDREGAENMLLTEFALSGSMPDAGTKATIAVQAQNNFEGLFDAIAMDLEDTFLEPLMSEIFVDVLQYAKDLDDSALLYVFALDEERAGNFKEAAKNPKALFEAIGEGFTFRGKGIRGLMRNTRIAQSITQLIATVGGIPPLFDVFEQDFSFKKSLAIMLKGYGIDPDEIKPSAEEKALIQQRQLVREQALAQSQLGENGQGPQNAPRGNANAPAPSNSGDQEPGSGAGQ